ncbi:Auxin-responsive protein IAA13, partial [Cucurbita argyrosperma subsp. argyrosperma]
MECTLGLFRTSGVGGSVSGSAINDPNESRMEIFEKDFVGKIPIEPSPCPASSGLELGLGLAVGGCGKVSGGTWGERGRILTARDFPVLGGSSVSSCSSSSCFHGREARAEEDEQSKDNKTSCDVDGKGHLGFVKVNVDGVVIGRKVDINAHSCYETLALMLEDMFFKSDGKSGDKEQGQKLSKLLDGSSEFVLTYEDREGDWMLVGDVPWSTKISRQESETKEQAYLKTATIWLGSGTS